MLTSLAGQTVVVTGGARRLGRAIVQACAASGASVAFTYRTSGDEATQLLAELRATNPAGIYAAYELEVSDGAAVRQFARQVLEEFPQVTGLVNCAAIFRRTPFAELTEQDFDEHIAANLKGPFLLCKEFGDHFLQSGGSIVNFSDIYGIRPLGNYIPYCLSKAGVIMLTQTLAKALAPMVRVNCICPGTILPPSEPQGDGPQGDGPPGDRPQGSGDPVEDYSVEDLVGRIPMGRLGTAEEIAQTVVFLLGGPQFISGAVLPVDGAQILR